MCYLTYSRLFSSVTGISLPLGFSSWTCIWPNESCSTENEVSITDEILLSLKGKLYLSLEKKKLLQ